MISIAIALLIVVGVVMVVLGYLLKNSKLKETSMIAVIGFSLIISCWSTFLLLMIVILLSGGDIK